MAEITTNQTRNMNALAADLDHVLAKTRMLWDELRDGRLFITGGTGFFGCWLLESFLWANERLRLGAEAVVLTPNADVFANHIPLLANHPAVKVHRGNVVDFPFPKGDLTHIIHAAGELTAADSAKGCALLETSFNGTRRVLDLARRCGAKKILFTSSGAVYGPARPGRQAMREDDLISPLPLDARGAYGEGKRLVEMLGTLFAQEHRIEFKIARGFAFLGPYLPLDAHFAAGNFIRDSLRGNPVLVRGNGTAVRSYLYGADLAVWLWTILFRGTSGRPYNVGSDAAISVGELARTIAGECRPPPPVRILGRIAADEAVDYYMPDISRARAELGLEIYITLPDAIRRTLRWHRQKWNSQA